MIVSVGLVLVHAHTRWTSTGSDTEFMEQISSSPLQPTVPLWRFYLQRSAFPSMDYTITMVLSIVLAVKYIFIDEDNFDCGINKKNVSSIPTSTGDEPITKPANAIRQRISSASQMTSVTPEYPVRTLSASATNPKPRVSAPVAPKDTVAVATKFLPQTPISPPANLVKKAAFNLGDFDETAEEDCHEISTQTEACDDFEDETIEREITASNRTYQDTVNILNGDVSNIYMYIYVYTHITHCKHYIITLLLYSNYGALFVLLNRFL